ncbi:MAG: hypothetical protein ACK52I_36850 [Pseudomonadota bacterium]
MARRPRSGSTGRRRPTQPGYVSSLQPLRYRRPAHGNGTMAWDPAAA